MRVWNFVSCDYSVLSGRADHLFRGILPTVVRRCRGSRNFKNEQAVVRIGPQHYRNLGVL